MGITFWVRQFVSALFVAFIVIAAAHLARGRGVDYAVTEATIWSVITAIVFTVAHYVKARRRPQCALPQAASDQTRD